MNMYVEYILLLREPGGFFFTYVGSNFSLLLEGRNKSLRKRADKERLGNAAEVANSLVKVGA